VGQDQHGAFAVEPFERRPQPLFGLGVEVARRLVEHQQPRRTQQRAGQGEPAPLPGGQPPSARSDHGVEGMRERGHLRVEPHGAQRVVDRDVGRRRVPRRAEGEDLPQRPPQVGRLLRDPGDAGVPGVGIELGEGHRTDRHLARVGCAEREQHRGEGGLARSRRADHDRALPRRQRQVDPVQRRQRPAGMGDGHPVQLDGLPRGVRGRGPSTAGARQAITRRCPASGLDALPGLDGLLQRGEEPIGRRRPLLVGVELLPQPAERPEGVRSEQQRDEHRLELRAAPGEADAGEDRDHRDPERGEQLEHQRREERDPQRAQRRHPQACRGGSHGDADTGRRACEADRGQRLQYREQLPGEVGQRLEPPPGDGPGREADQDHEGRDERQDHQQYETGPEVCRQHPAEQRQRDDDGVDEGRQVAPEGAVEGVDAVGEQADGASQVVVVLVGGTPQEPGDDRVAEPGLDARRGALGQQVARPPHPGPHDDGDDEQPEPRPQRRKVGATEEGPGDDGGEGRRLGDQRARGGERQPHVQQQQPAHRGIPPPQPRVDRWSPPAPLRHPTDRWRQPGGRGHGSSGSRPREARASRRSMTSMGVSVGASMSSRLTRCRKTQ
jgi:hypothetical protein